MRIRICTGVLMFCLLSGTGFSVSAEHSVRSEPSHVGFFLQYARYGSYSQTKNSFPLKAGYPVFQAGLWSAGLSVRIPWKAWSLNAGLDFSRAETIQADNGTGRNPILLHRSGSLNQWFMNVRLTTTLLQWNSLTLLHGPALALAAENRILEYRTGVKSEKGEWSAGAGPALLGQVAAGENVSLTAGFQALFHIPWLSSGRRTDSMDGGPFFSSAYHTFYYQTVLELELMWEFLPERSFTAGYRRFDWVGFGNEKPSFTADRLVSHKLDRVHIWYAGFVFTIQ